MKYIAAVLFFMVLVVMGCDTTEFDNVSMTPKDRCEANFGDVTDLDTPEQRSLADQCKYL